jgi:hypothetical protein
MVEKYCFNKNFTKLFGGKEDEDNNRQENGQT